MSQSLSIVIMAYNEEASIKAQSEATARFLRRIDLDGQVIIVNDGSSDKTGEIAAELAANDPIYTVVHHHTNLGMGRAIRSGYAAARANCIPAARRRPSHSRHFTALFALFAQPRPSFIDVHQA